LFGDHYGAILNLLLGLDLIPEIGKKIGLGRQQQNHTARSAVTGEIPDMVYFRDQQAVYFVFFKKRESILNTLISHF
jgi:hypothetical protein